MNNPINTITGKPLHAKPGIYTYYFEMLKEVALKYGYNLTVHGSMNRDLDLVAFPWNEELLPHEDMIKEMSELIGGEILLNDDMRIFSDKPHGRIVYIISLNRSDLNNLTRFHDLPYEDKEYYLDISVFKPR